MRHALISLLAGVVALTASCTGHIHTPEQSSLFVTPVAQLIEMTQ